MKNLLIGASETIRNKTQLSKIISEVGPLELSIHRPNKKSLDKLNDEEFGYYLAGLIESIGEIEGNSENIQLKINIKNNISFAFSLKKRIGFGKITVNKENKQAIFTIINKKGIEKVFQLIYSKFKFSENFLFLSKGYIYKLGSKGEYLTNIQEYLNLFPYCMEEKTSHNTRIDKSATLKGNSSYKESRGVGKLNLTNPNGVGKLNSLINNTFWLSGFIDGLGQLDIKNNIIKIEFNNLYSRYTFNSNLSLLNELVNHFGGLPPKEVNSEGFYEIQPHCVGFYFSLNSKTSYNFLKYFDKFSLQIKYLDYVLYRKSYLKLNQIN